MVDDDTVVWAELVVVAGDLELVEVDVTLGPEVEVDEGLVEVD